MEGEGDGGNNPNLSISKSVISSQLFASKTVLEIQICLARQT